MEVSGVLIGSAVGVALGLLARLHRGLARAAGNLDRGRQLAFPYLLLAIAILAVVGPSVPALIAVLGIRTWVVYARTVRASVLSVIGREFTEAARALGARPMRVALRHLLPNVVAPITVLATAELGSLILLESTLSFLGIGVQPLMPSWLLLERRPDQGCGCLHRAEGRRRDARRLVPTGRQVPKSSFGHAHSSRPRSSEPQAHGATSRPAQPV